MKSRRAFLQTTCGLAATTLLPSTSFAGNAADTASALPPAIAKLRSMKDQARPITREERHDRQEKRAA